MRIAIDASRTTVARVTGTEHYAIELISALIRLNTQHELILCFRDAPPPNLFPLSPLVAVRVLPQRRLWTHTRFAAALWHDRPDVTFVPAHTLPFFFPGCAAVTVHDLGFRYFPAAHPRFQRLYLDWTTRSSAHRARVVFADSRATADDLARLYGLAPDKIRVVYPGVDAPPVGDVEQVRIRVEGDGDGGWLAGVPGAELAETGPRGLLVRLEPGAEVDAVLDAARAAGTVTHFSLERPTLTDLFRAAVTA